MVIARRHHRHQDTKVFWLLAFLKYTLPSVLFSLLFSLLSFYFLFDSDFAPQESLTIFSNPSFVITFIYFFIVILIIIKLGVLLSVPAMIFDLFLKKYFDLSYRSFSANSVFRKILLIILPIILLIMTQFYFVMLSLSVGYTHLNKMFFANTSFGKTLEEMHHKFLATNEHKILKIWEKALEKSNINDKHFVFLLPLSLMDKAENFPELSKILPYNHLNFLLSPTIEYAIGRNFYSQSIYSMKFLNILPFETNEWLNSGDQKNKNQFSYYNAGHHAILAQNFFPKETVSKETQARNCLTLLKNRLYFSLPYLWLLGRFHILGLADRDLKWSNLTVMTGDVLETYALKMNDLNYFSKTNLFILPEFGKEPATGIKLFYFYNRENLSNERPQKSLDKQLALIVRLLVKQGKSFVSVVPFNDLSYDKPVNFSFTLSNTQLDKLPDYLYGYSLSSQKEKASCSFEMARKTKAVFPYYNFLDIKNYNELKFNKNFIFVMKQNFNFSYVCQIENRFYLLQLNEKEQSQFLLQSLSGYNIFTWNNSLIKMLKPKTIENDELWFKIFDVYKIENHKISKIHDDENKENIEQSIESLDKAKMSEVIKSVIYKDVENYLVNY